MWIRLAVRGVKQNSTCLSINVFYINILNVEKLRYYMDSAYAAMLPLNTNKKSPINIFWNFLAQIPTMEYFFYFKKSLLRNKDLKINILYTFVWMLIVNFNCSITALNSIIISHCSITMAKYCPSHCLGQDWEAYNTN